MKTKRPVGWFTGFGFMIGMVLLCPLLLAESSSLVLLNDNGVMCYNADSLPQQLVIESSGSPTVIAAVNDAVPGLTDTYLAEIILGFDMNDNGLVVFPAKLKDGAGSSRGYGIFTAAVGEAIKPIAVTNQSCAEGIYVSFEDYPRINNSGQISFVADANDHAVFKPFLYRYSPASGIEKLIGTGTVLDPCGAKIVNDVCCNVPINRSGHVLGKVWLADGATVLCLCSGPNDFRVIASAGDAFGAGFFTDFDKGVLNDNDEILIKAEVDDISRLLFYSGGTFTEIMAAGDYLMNERAVMGIPCHYDLNNSGHAGFRTCFEDASTAVFYWDRTRYYLVAQSGTEFAEKTFYAFKPHVAITENNVLFFMAKYSYDCEDFGIYSWSKPSGFKELIKVGDTAHGGTVTSMETKGALFQRCVNNSEQIAQAVIVNANYTQPYPTIFQGICPEKIAGDIDADCKVDLLDFALLAGNWLFDYYHPAADL